MVASTYPVHTPPPLRAALTGKRPSGSPFLPSIFFSPSFLCCSLLLLLQPQASNPHRHSFMLRPSNFFLSASSASSRLVYCFVLPVSAPKKSPSIARRIGDDVNPPRHKNKSSNHRSLDERTANFLLARSVFHCIPCSHPPWGILLAASSNPLKHRQPAIGVERQGYPAPHPGHRRISKTQPLPEPYTACAALTGSSQTAKPSLAFAAKPLVRRGLLFLTLSNTPP
ncbi:hypothetical protein CCMA1212_001785 [Trichoderma ghanense]|uniref:Uncharacterized protein n=1 Tax=Trichoderma ghanense TaxID=65468 RepID=A0ABY2HDF0_9HYPO